MVVFCTLVELHQEGSLRSRLVYICKLLKPKGPIEGYGKGKSGLVQPSNIEQKYSLTIMFLQWFTSATLDVFNVCSNAGHGKTLLWILKLLSIVRVT